jgi:hypothetical protein
MALGPLSGVDEDMHNLYIEAVQKSFFSSGDVNEVAVRNTGAGEGSVEL